MGESLPKDPSKQPIKRVAACNSPKKETTTDAESK